MSDQPPVLDPAVLAVLQGARPLTEAPVASKTRIQAALEQRIVALPPGGGEGGGSDDGGAGGAGPGGGPAPGALAWATAHPLLALGAVLAVGGVLGALVRDATLPAPRVIYVDRIVTAPAPSSTAVAPPPAATSAAIPVESLPNGAPAAPSVAPAAPIDSGEHLRAESALLDVARSALARGEAAPALAAVDRHAATFPSGILREEREALGIKALLLAGRVDQASARAARFREQYPTSVFRAALDSALRSAPR